MSNYIVDPTLGFGPIPVPPQPTRNAWVELNRTTLGVASSTISVVVPKKRFLMVLMRSTGNPFDVNMFLQFNGDTGSNYSSRIEKNGAADLPSANVTAIFVGGDNDFDPDFSIAYIDNKPFGPKLVQAHDCEQGLPGVGIATRVPNRIESAGKWSPSDLSDQITTVTLTTLTAQVWNVGSEVIVLGFDPTDAQDDTFNFWQPLAKSVNTSSNMLLNFTAKKYLWLQWYFKLNAGLFRQKLRFNADAGNNYTFRESSNGAADTTTLTRDGIIIGTNSANLIRHCEMFIVNEQVRNKLCISHFEGSLANGPGTGVSREEQVSKWANTLAQINQIELIDDAGGGPTLVPGESFMRVWGHD